MLPPLLDKVQPSPADRWLWGALGVMVVGQVVALWLLCQQQVDKAEVREAALRAQRVAMMDTCAPQNGRATCMPISPRQPGPPSPADVGAVMSAFR